MVGVAEGGITVHFFTSHKLEEVKHAVSIHLPVLHECAVGHEASEVHALPHPGTGVAVGDGVFVGLGVGVFVGLGVGVFVGGGVGVLLGEGVDVLDGLGVGVLLGEDVRTHTLKCALSPP